MRLARLRGQWFLGRRLHSGDADRGLCSGHHGYRQRIMSDLRGAVGGCEYQHAAYTGWNERLARGIASDYCPQETGDRYELEQGESAASVSVTLGASFAAPGSFHSCASDGDARVPAKAVVERSLTSVSLAERVRATRPQDEEENASVHAGSVERRATTGNPDHPSREAV